MKTISLKAEVRDTKTKGDLNQLRKRGMVPGHIYDAHLNLPIKVDARDLNKIIYTPDTYLIELEVDGKVYPTILKEVQFHKVSDRPIHIDLQIISENKPVVVTLPVNTKGQAEGVKIGGKLHTNMRRLKVKGLVKDLPDAIELDISSLGVGKTIVCGDVKIPGVQVLHPDNLAIVGVKATRNVLEESAASAAASTATKTKGATASTSASSGGKSASGAKSTTAKK